MRQNTMNLIVALLCLVLVSTTIAAQTGRIPQSVSLIVEASCIGMAGACLFLASLHQEGWQAWIARILGVTSFGAAASSIMLLLRTVPA